jgi:hypothetical protein
MADDEHKLIARLISVQLKFSIFGVKAGRQQNLP